MTCEEVFERIDLSHHIRCDNVQERNEVLLFLERFGYEISAASKEYFNDPYTDGGRFLCPGLSDGRSLIACYSMRSDQDILYKDISDIVKNAYPAPFLDEKEFAAAFAELMSVSNK